MVSVRAPGALLPECRLLPTGGSIASAGCMQCRHDRKYMLACFPGIDRMLHLGDITLISPLLDGLCDNVFT